MPRMEQFIASINIYDYERFRDTIKTRCNISRTTWSNWRNGGSIEKSTNPSSTRWPWKCSDAPCSAQSKEASNETLALPPPAQGGQQMARQGREKRLYSQVYSQRPRLAQVANKERKLKMFCGSCIFFRPYHGQTKYPKLGYCNDDPFTVRVVENSHSCPQYKPIKNHGRLSLPS